MKRACLVCLVLLFSTTLFGQSNPVILINQQSGSESPSITVHADLKAQTRIPNSQATPNIARQSTRRIAINPLPIMSYKSPIMQRLFASKHNHRATAANQSPGPAASPFLTTPPMYPTGTNAFDLALGDFNSDGKQDVIVAANPPLLLLGNGDGTLQAAASIGSIPSNPTGVAVGDFNRDGNLDVVIAIAGGAVVYLGNGNGSFGAGITVPSGSTNQNVYARVLAADVNNDGIPDLILNTDAGLSVLLSNGNGTFQSPIISSGTVQFMAVADFNKDGNVDLAVTDGYNNLSIVLGNGQATFVVASTYSAMDQNLNAIAIADYNQDGFQDVALPNGQVFLGNGDGTLRAPSAFSTSPHATVVTAVDLNGDGIPDLVTVGSGYQCGNNDFGTTEYPPGKGTVRSNLS